jgi:hypothetical protein
MAGQYILSSSITDSIARRFVDSTDVRVPVWLERANEQIERLALTFDIRPNLIITPVHPIVADYGRSVFCSECFLDNIGVNNVETPADEKYRIKYDLYIDKTKILRGQITPEMFDTTSSDLDSDGIAGGGDYFWRG